VVALGLNRGPGESKQGRFYRKRGGYSGALLAAQKEINHLGFAGWGPRGGKKSSDFLLGK